MTACAPEQPAGQQLPEAPETTQAAPAEEPAEAPATTAAAPAETEAGAEVPEEIVIGIPASLTGQYEALGRQGLDGLQMFADWVNEER
ncbi:MAG: hypothetical protein M3N51_11170, partial [Actinomycetota bacterium]|nr:hypothetical protein [Actinomycetota bacterium]